ncbi:MAG: histidinol dehydrogenase [Bacteroidales bacterium]|nr:histidinol dehydrogenase [Bacteroidales bacterium]
MEITAYPTREEWAALLARPEIEKKDLTQQVGNIIEEVKQRGDKALIAYARKFDKAGIEIIRVTREEFETAERSVSLELKNALEQAARNIRKFHKAQIQEDVIIQTMPGIECRQKAVAIPRVGLYVPGGTAPLFSSVLMMAIPAKIAACREIVICTPPSQDGSVDAAILYAAQLTGINKVYKTGGAQAIAAMAYGTESIPKIDKIFGPGNQYVTKAKQMVSLEGTAIDMPAGPSEVMVIADESTNPKFAAIDLLSQAEHGPDSQVVMIGSNRAQLENTRQSLVKLMMELPRMEVARKALRKSRLILLEEKAIPEIINFYAPEHLIISTKDPEFLAEKVENAGSVFLGEYTPESLGDYASGTNHVLPTNGYARAYSGINLDSFMKKITFQKATQKGLEAIAPTVEQMAAAEQLEAHRLAVSLRVNKIGGRA